MRDLYMDVNERPFCDSWSRRVIIGNPYVPGCTFLNDIGQVDSYGRFSSPSAYATRLLSKRPVV